MQASEQASMNDVQKAEAIASTETQIEQAKSQFEIQRMETSTKLKGQYRRKLFHNWWTRKFSEKSNSNST